MTWTRTAFAFTLLFAASCSDRAGSSNTEAPRTRVCAWAESDQFINAALGEVADLPLLLRERNGLKTTIKVLSTEDSVEGVFAGAPTGAELVLEPYERRLIRQFATSDVPVTATRTLQLESSIPCEGGTRPLIQSVTFADGTYRVEPDELTFAPVPVATLPDGGVYSLNGSFRTLTLFNDSNGAVNFELNFVPGSPFSISGESVVVRRVEARTSAPYSLWFLPREVGGQYTSSVSVRAGANFQKTVALHGAEGGPRLLNPPEVDFGLVAYFPNANPPSSATRHFYVENAGRDPVGLDGGGDLVLPSGGANFRLSMTGTPLELELQWVDGGVWSSGLRLAPGETALLKVTFTPTGVGRTDTALFIPAPYATPMRVRADTQILPPCEQLVVGSPLEVPLDGGFSDGGMRNLGTSMCLLDGFFLEQAAPYFQLISPTDSVQLGASQTLPIVVRALPAAFPDAGAGLRFSVSSPNPSRLLPVVAVP